jgi:subtilase family serine protease
MNVSLRKILAIIAVSLFAGFSEASAQTAQLTGTVSPEALKLPNLGDLPSSRSLLLEMRFKPRHQAQLTQLLAKQQDPKSSQYHQWLTPQEYTKRFGVTEQEFNKVSSWLKKEGFQITSGSPANGFIRFTGSVLSIGHTFGTRIAKFSADGSKYGNLTDPQIPAEYDDLVGNMTGLSNLHASKPMIEPSPDITLSDFTAVGPADFYAFYDETPLQNTGVTGTGCIAIVGDSDFNPGPIQAFNNQFGLPDNSASITEVLADASNPGINGDEVETLLDLEWSHAVAPGAATKYFLGNESSSTNGGIVDALSAAVTDGSCAVISISFGLCGEPGGFYTSTVATIVNQAQSQGQAIMISAGDQGAAGLVFSVNQCVTATTANVNELASNPLITSVGGTSLNAPFDAAGVITGYTSERVWDDPNDGIPGGGATGGGASVFFSKPSFQSGVTPADGARDQPDVALLASPNFPGVFVFEDNNGAGALGVVGGTSFSAPAWAGIVDLLVQQSGGKVGSINSKVYALASAGQAAAGFHDITTGNNGFNGVTGFSAGPGYDQATGWGSVDVNQFVTAMAAAATGTPTPTPATPTPVATPTPAPTPAPIPTPVPTPTPTPRVSASVGLSQGALNFGKVKVGNSKTKVMTLTNTAKKKGGATITFNGGSLAGSSEFGGSTNCTGLVGPKGKCKVMVLFAPNSVGGASATITVNGNASNSPTSFSVTGTGK